MLLNQNPVQSITPGGPASSALPPRAGPRRARPWAVDTRQRLPERGRHLQGQPETGSEHRGQAGEGSNADVAGAPDLDPRDVRLLDAEHAGHLLLRESVAEAEGGEAIAEADEVTGERRVQGVGSSCWPPPVKGGGVGSLHGTVSIPESAFSQGKRHRAAIPDGHVLTRRFVPGAKNRSRRRPGSGILGSTCCPVSSLSRVVPRKLLPLVRALAASRDGLHQGSLHLVPQGRGHRPSFTMTGRLF